MMKKLKAAGADTGVTNRAMRPIWNKQEEKLAGSNGSFQRAMKRPDFGLRNTPKLREASDAIAVKPRKTIQAKDPAAAARKRAAAFERPAHQKGEAFEAPGLGHFLFERDRNPEGQFAPGQVANADDFAMAMAPKPKLGLGKKLAIGAGAAGAGALAWKEAPAIGRVLKRVGSHF